MNRILPLVALVALAVAVPAQATVVEALTLQQMCDQSHSAFHGTCASVRTEWTSDHAYVVTIYEFRVTEWLKGGDGAATTFVTHLGGEKDGVGTGVSGMPRYAEGEEVVLFLNQSHEATGCCMPLGLGQGAFHVKASDKGGLAVFRSFAGLVFWNPVTGTASQPEAELTGEQPLADFLAEVRTRIAASR